jgi:hypothetical protein
MSSKLMYALADARMQEIARSAADSHRAPRRKRIALRLPTAPRLRRARRTVPA